MSGIPHDLEAEESVIGSCILANEKVLALREIISPQDFYAMPLKHAYSAILALSERGEPIDELLIRNEMERQGTSESGPKLSELCRIVDDTPTAATAICYAQIVREKSLRRKLMFAGIQIMDGASASDTLPHEVIEETTRELAALNASRKPTGAHARDAVKIVLSSLEDRYRNKGQITGVTTGFEALDNLLLGMQPADLIILAARPSMGKTAIAMNIAVNAARKKKRVLVFTLEMATKQLVERMLSSEGRVDALRLRSGYVADDDWPRIARGAGLLAELPMWFEEASAITINEIRARTVSRARDWGGVDLVVIDYLGLAKAAKKHDRHDLAIAELTSGLKALAKEFCCPVLCLAQLNREVEKRADKRPMMSDLRDSGAIEQDADVIAFLYRDEVYNPETTDKGMAEIIIAKHRNGPLATIKTRFFPAFTRFENEVVR